MTQEIYGIENKTAAQKEVVISSVMSLLIILFSIVF